MYANLATASSAPRTDVLLGRGTYDYWSGYWPTAGTSRCTSFVNGTHQARLHVHTKPDSRLAQLDLRRQPGRGVRRTS